ncbi:MAG: hypothetical protein ACC657_13580 [Thiohalomonadales bacterium]
MLTGLSENKKNMSKSEIVLNTENKFIYSRLDEKYSNKINVTYRSPRKVDGKIKLTPVTSSINTSELYELRVEEIDNTIFIVNNHKSIYRDNDYLRLPIADKKTAYQIIDSIITEFERVESKESKIIDVKHKYEDNDDELEEDSPGINSKISIIIKILEKFGNYAIGILIATLLISAIIWFLADTF